MESLSSDRLCDVAGGVRVRGKNDYAGVVVMVSICLGLVLGAAMIHRPAVAQQVITWKMQASYPVGTAVMMHDLEWAKEIEKRTNGRLKVEILPPGAICDVKDIINFMSKGVFDCAITYGGFYTGMIPETDLEMVGLPQGHRTWEEVKDAMYKRGLGEVIQAAYDEHNIKWWPTAAGALLLPLQHQFRSQKTG